MRWEPSLRSSWFLYVMISLAQMTRKGMIEETSFDKFSILGLWCLAVRAMQIGTVSCWSKVFFVHVCSSRCRLCVVFSVFGVHHHIRTIHSALRAAAAVSRNVKVVQGGWEWEWEWEWMMVVSILSREIYAFECVSLLFFFVLTTCTWYTIQAGYLPGTIRSLRYELQDVERWIALSIATTCSILAVCTVVVDYQLSITNLSQRTTTTCWRCHDVLSRRKKKVLEQIIW